MKVLLAGALAVMASAGLPQPASAEASEYTLSPAGPLDPRNSFVAPVGAVFVVDDARGQISICFPDNKEGRVQVVCRPATKLP